MLRTLRRDLSRLGEEYDEALQRYEMYSDAKPGHAIYDDIMNELHDEKATRKELRLLVSSHVPSYC
jgi:hypothetical protein